LTCGGDDDVVEKMAETAVAAGVGAGRGWSCDVADSAASRVKQHCAGTTAAETAAAKTRTLRRRHATSTTEAPATVTT
jgi:hypothetical protein